MKLSEREWTVLQALWQTDGAELGTLVNLLHPGDELEPQYGTYVSDPHGNKRAGCDR